MIANAYEGETTITLCDKKYPMKINLAFMAKFESSTGLDFNSIAVKAISEWQKAKDLEPMQKAAMISAAVPMSVAAYAFYIGAHACDSQVTFEEIQDAVLNEGVIIRKSKAGFTESYPVKFVALAVFALVNIYSDKKKA